MKGPFAPPSIEGRFVIVRYYVGPENSVDHCRIELCLLLTEGLHRPMSTGMCILIVGETIEDTQARIRKEGSESVKKGMGAGRASWPAP